VRYWPLCGHWNFCLFVFVSGGTGA
jgi:hypothetical protein